MMSVNDPLGSTADSMNLMDSSFPSTWIGCSDPNEGYLCMEPDSMSRRTRKLAERGRAELYSHFVDDCQKSLEIP